MLASHYITTLGKKGQSSLPNWGVYVTRKMQFYLIYYSHFQFNYFYHHSFLLFYRIFSLQIQIFIIIYNCSYHIENGHIKLHFFLTTNMDPSPSSTTLILLAPTCYKMQVPMKGSTNFFHILFICGSVSLSVIEFSIYHLVFLSIQNMNSCGHQTGDLPSFLSRQGLQRDM